MVTSSCFSNNNILTKEDGQKPVLRLQRSSLGLIDPDSRNKRKLSLSSYMQQRWMLNNLCFWSPGAHLRKASSQEARRSSLGHVPTIRHRASDAFLDPHHAAILFRDSRGVSYNISNTPI